MPKRDTQVPVVGATWTPPQPFDVAVSLFINCPPDHPVRRNTVTGQIEIDNLSIEDLIGLQQSIGEQVDQLRAQAASNWSAL